MDDDKLFLEQYRQIFQQRQQHATLVWTIPTVVVAVGAVVVNALPKMGVLQLHPVFLWMAAPLFLWFLYGISGLVLRHSFFGEALAFLLQDMDMRGQPEKPLPRTGGDLVKYKHRISPWAQIGARCYGVDSLRHVTGAISTFLFLVWADLQKFPPVETVTVAIIIALFFSVLLKKFVWVFGSMTAAGALTDGARLRDDEETAITNSGRPAALWMILSWAITTLVAFATPILLYQVNRPIISIQNLSIGDSWRMPIQNIGVLPASGVRVSINVCQSAGGPFEVLQPSESQIDLLDKNEELSLPLEILRPSGDASIFIFVAWHWEWQLAQLPVLRYNRFRFWMQNRNTGRWVLMSEHGQLFPLHQDSLKRLKQNMLLSIAGPRVKERLAPLVRS